MHFNDLSLYKYDLSKTLSDVYNIGWLERDIKFQKGIVDNEILNKLAIIIRERMVHAMRGIHPCQFCEPYDPMKTFTISTPKGPTLLGMSEIWLPDYCSSKIYAAPSLIHHYIDKHNYLPPIEFIKSIEAFDINSEWDGDKEREKRVSLLHSKFEANSNN